MFSVLLLLHKTTAKLLYCFDCVNWSKMDAILNTERQDLEDYYGLLGCDELSTSEQILTEFKARALECHPDKHPENPKAVEEFQKLQQAKDILTNEESRSRYDYWHRSGITVPFHQWDALSDSVKMSMHWAVKNKKEPMLEASSSETTDKSGSSNPLYQLKERKNDSPADKLKQEDIDISTNMIEDDSQFSKYSTSPRMSDVNYWHMRFRWSADAPSDLLRKFRNYEI
ncbi:dnaJ homolog subfamily C member 12 [Protopterus annectens]|uniref:dnaJ homolog subfamily C member 12 n=1 Tax=Protopterus annectens TaxID=7888 RepID=UPI001CFB7819|nr:dnaJ homolog subfamily C member 12 [Protopterus annectens]